MTGTVFNNGRTAQTLDSITLPGTGATVKLSPAKGKGPVTVPPNGGWVRLGGEGNASAVIEDGREAAKDGNAQPVVFSFSDTGDVGLRALVVPAKSYFEGVGPSTPPSPTASPSASESCGRRRVRIPVRYGVGLRLRVRSAGVGAALGLGVRVEHGG